MLRPLDRSNGKRQPRQLNETEQRRVRQQHEKAAHKRRNRK